MELLPLYLYYALFVLLSVHGIHRAALCLRFLRGRTRPPADVDRLVRDRLPAVTVQVPLFNELYVAARVVDAVAALDWPRDRIEIQILDDSTDDTSRIVADRVEALARGGIRVEHIRRRERRGFKAGALAFGLAGGEGWAPATGEFVAVFDADFLPRPDFLLRTVPLLVADPRLAVVQARWEHVNREHSLLTRLQAIFLDAHFAVEHEARRRAGLLLNFNGTAGVWRRSAIAEAGGWSYDTLTEDLDLSFRSQMQGRRFTYVDAVGVPSELPVEMNAFKTQQHRWAKGSIETARKLLWRLLLRRDLPLATRLEGGFHLVNNVAYLLIFLVSVLALPVAQLKATAASRWTGLFDFYLVGIGILPVVAYFLLGQIRVGRRLLPTLALIPFALALGIGISLNNAKAVLDGLFQRRSGFVRTPKYRLRESDDTWVGKRYLAGRSLLPVLELALGASCSLSVWVAIANGNPSFGVLMTLFAGGWLYVGIASLMPASSERLRRHLAALGVFGAGIRSRGLERPSESSAGA